MFYMSTNLIKEKYFMGNYFLIFKNISFIYLFLEGKGERDGGKMIGCLSHTPNWGPVPQPRHVSWLGIEPATLWFPGSIHWATVSRAIIS